MIMSDKIGELAKALTQIQAEVTNTKKDAKGYGYKYTELSGVLDEVRPLCAKYGIGITQLCTSENLDSSSVAVTTMLLHSSGEYIGDTLSLPVTLAKGLSHAQCVGMVITYARRYALAAILGITQTDDDGSTKTTVDQDVFISLAQIDYIKHLIGPDKERMDKVLDYLKVDDLSKIKSHEYTTTVNLINRANQSKP